MMFQKILVVCTGNICRSPMAEALLSKQFLERNQKIDVSSAGINALANHPADPIVQELMSTKGLNVSNHRARQLTRELLLDNELILIMETRHQEGVEGILSSVRGKVHRLGKWGGFDILDPYQRPRFAYEQALALIEQGVGEWQRKLWN
jgi:protein-tyrosine phosphatase